MAGTRPATSTPREIKPNSGGICKTQVLVGVSLDSPQTFLGSTAVFLEISVVILAQGLCAFPWSLLPPSTSRDCPSVRFSISQECYCDKLNIALPSPQYDLATRMDL